ncbi:hypothetical protein GCM10011491_05500 [Brucella endophytica]|uniref:Uncharacterized protein n=1 Tax=Brucella endophytica TaxID=1963359 RepID=A0A916S2S1_9HYPH|nr:hypothetical protein [Brucella endophytica]GGA81107.1 hypothetical protein GCM10011491_05500 [Brucella endophytica]
MMLATSPFSETLLNAQIKAAEVQIVADRLAALMQEIHGMRFDLLINHDLGFIFIKGIPDEVRS